MRIVLLSDRIPPEQLGGAEKVVWALAVGLAQAGHDIHLIAGTDNANRTETREGVTTHYVHAQVATQWRGWLSVINPAVVRRVRHLLRTLKPEVVNAHNIHNQLSFACLWAAQQIGIPTVFTAHDFMTFTYGKLTHGIDQQRGNVASPAAYRLPPLYNLRLMRSRFNPFRTLAIRYVLARTRVRTCVGEAHRDALQANLNLPFEVVYNGVDPSAYRAAPEVIERLRTRWNIAERPVVLFSGRFGREKGSRHLLLAMQQVVKTVPDALLLILTAAKPDQLSDYDDPQFRELWDKHVITGGWLHGGELSAAYHLADVVTVPSIYVDPTPTVNLDAMASGKPVVGTCFGGTPEIVKDGDTGLIVNPFNITQFAESIILLLQDARLRQQMGAEGKRRLDELFTLSRQVQQMLTLYQRAVQAP
jgi:glycosyltransferase involved in cell wall biosynthesis